MKQCTCCKNKKLLDNFTLDRSKKDGYSSWCKKCMQQYRETNKEKISRKNKLWSDKNKNYQDKWYESNKDKKREYNKQYQENNKAKIAENKKKYRKDTIEHTRACVSKRRKENPLFKFKQDTRSLINKSFKRSNNLFSKKNKTEEILGCSLEEFKNFISSKFTQNMSFENHGEWHLDHIVPLASAATEEDIIKLNHYTNFQPLWALDNLIKGSKLF